MLTVVARKIALLAVSGVMIASGDARAEAASRPLRIAAAASTKPALDELARAFERASPGARVLASFGASGALFAQIASGAPFDLFLSADREFPRRLVAEGLASEEVVYGAATLALWLSEGSPVEPARGLAALADPAVRRVAMPNPAVAPWGRAAEAALRAAGVHAAVAGKLVLGESVGQAAQFADSGATDAALVPLPFVRGTGLAARGRTLALPLALAPPVEQSAVVLSRARDAALAREFVAFLRGAAARDVLARHGYLPVP